MKLKELQATLDRMIEEDREVRELPVTASLDGRPLLEAQGIYVSNQGFVYLIYAGLEEGEEDEA